MAKQAPLKSSSNNHINPQDFQHIAVMDSAELERSYALNSVESSEAAATGTQRLATDLRASHEYYKHEIKKNQALMMNAAIKSVKSQTRQHLPGQVTPQKLESRPVMTMDRRALTKEPNYWDRHSIALRTESPEVKAAENRTNRSIKAILDKVLPEKRKSSERQLRLILAESPNLKSIKTKQWLRKRTNFYNK